MMARSEVVVLHVRQHPKYAVVTPENKEKMRKPVDPPPIVQLKVDRRHDAGSNYLVNPFLFMTASLVDTEEQEDGSYRPVSGDQIIGQNVSSLHRLKDVDNKDGGFFVFGDISCRHIGQYRIQFNLFDLEKDNNQVVFVESVVSEPFKVVSLKEFRGLSESTVLSRTFSDQGVRLRLRKEPRTITGSKRTWDSSPPEPSTSPMHQNLYSGPSSERSFAYESTPFKRTRSDSDHNSYSYPASQYSGSAVSHVGSNLNTDSPWLAHPQQSFHPDQSPALGGLAPQYYSHPNNFQGYQRHLPQGPYPAPPTLSNNPYHSNASAIPRNQPNVGYAQQMEQQFDSRFRRDVYQAPPILQAPTPTSNAAIASIQSQNFLPASTETIGQAGEQNPGTAQPQYAQQPPQAQSSVGQYSFHPVAMHPSGQAYQPPPHPDVQSVVYDQTGQSHLTKFERDHYQDTQGIYSDPSRVPYPTTTSTISDANLSLDAGMLNRSFAPPQQGSYDAVAEQDLSDFKRSHDPYPTPNQTSPMG